MQMTFFFLLPSMLLSGCMFRLAGCRSGRRLGEIFPLTHFLRIVRGVLLEDNVAAGMWSHVRPSALFLVVARLIALARYRQTLD